MYNYASILHVARRQPPSVAAIGRDAYYKRKQELKERVPDDQMLEQFEQQKVSKIAFI